ncbi:hypothetical protein K6119_04375 [Paracrocinitomix mangrovi]|uniref:hypothetical protein n=1 Tax=Paracrocinitomix mangrovi TaxID=2862509 RepID=UPI001C8ED361|nr:hypothetical protein [Paracrocinitomix mangrovi]UKN02750.1 hypothetical protein K6119_04375 [Paracrocinitomix mangrovi]
MKFYFIAISLFTSIVSFSQNKKAALIVAEFVGTEPNMYFDCITATHFKNGKFVSKESILNKSDISWWSKKSKQPFEYGPYYIASNRFVVYKFGFCFDTKTKKIFNIDGLILNVTDSSVVYTTQERFKEPLYYKYNFDNETTCEIQYLPSNSKRVISPNQSAFAESKYQEKLFIKIGSTNTIDTFTWVDTLVSRNQIISSDQIIMHWLDNSTLIVSLEILTSKGIGILLVAYDLEKKKKTVIEPFIRNRFFDHNTKFRSKSDQYVYLDLENGYLQLDVNTLEIKTGSGLKYNYNIERSVAEDGSTILLHNSDTIRKGNIAFPIAVTSDYIGMDLPTEDINMFFSEKYTVWNSKKNNWIEFDTKGACRVIGWINE